MGVRRGARELALKCLFQWDQRPDDGRELADEVIAKWSADPEEHRYCRQLLEVFWRNAAAIDERIQAAAENWRLERMSTVDRTVLRLATAELLYVDEVPARVCLDEGIELAKLYSGEKSGAFVNGILDRIMNEGERRNGA